MSSPGSGTGCSGRQPRRRSRCYARLSCLRIRCPAGRYDQGRARFRQTNDRHGREPLRRVMWVACAVMMQAGRRMHGRNTIARPVDVIVCRSGRIPPKRAHDDGSRPRPEGRQRGTPGISGRLRAETGRRGRGGRGREASVEAIPAPYGHAAGYGWAAAHGTLYPWHGLSQVLDHDPGNLPPGIEFTVAGLDAPGLRRAARASAKVLTTASEAAAGRHPADLPTAMAAYVTLVLSREPNPCTVAPAAEHPPPPR